MSELEQFVEILKESHHIVFFGGAGVSTASNIPDFRSASGIYSRKYERDLNPEQVVSHSFFMSNPDEFYDFYRKYLVYPDAKPNGCHRVLAELERIGKLDAIVTQNIDGLHQAAGSKKVWELHGSVLRNYCMQCYTPYDVTAVTKAEGVPHCEHCGGVIRPDVVLYEEGLEDRIVEGAIDAIRHADTLIIGGTSLVVYPAAGLIRYFNGKYIVLINKSTTSADSTAEIVLRDSIDKVMEQAYSLMTD